MQTALSGADLYYWFVSGFGNMDHLTDPYAAAFDVPMIGSIVSLTVQIFFVYRIWVLSGRKSWVLCLIICVVSVSYQSPAHTSLSFVLVLWCKHSSRVWWGYLCKFCLS